MGMIVVSGSSANFQVTFAPSSISMLGGLKEPSSFTVMVYSSATPLFTVGTNSATKAQTSIFAALQSRSMPREKKTVRPNAFATAPSRRARAGIATHSVAVTSAMQGKQVAPLACACVGEGSSKAAGDTAGLAFPQTLRLSIAATFAFSDAALPSSRSAVTAQLHWKRSSVTFGDATGNLRSSGGGPGHSNSRRLEVSLLYPLQRESLQKAVQLQLSRLNQTDPPDARERQRNDRIAAEQRRWRPAREGRRRPARRCGRSGSSRRRAAGSRPARRRRR